MNFSKKITTLALGVALLVSPSFLVCADTAINANTETVTQEPTALKLARATRRCFESASALALLTTAAYVMPICETMENNHPVQWMGQIYAFLGLFGAGSVLALKNVVEYDAIETTQEESNVASIASGAKQMGALGLTAAGAIMATLFYKNFNITLKTA